MSDQCENVELPRPCIYCAKTGHELWCCPLTKICFKCGVPGHINRECPERRHIPRRLVCGTCFMSGHDRSQCREKIYNIPSYNARCFVCGQTGHFMCKSMQWFFGLTGISCYNCGETGHHAIECKRPKLSDLARNAELALNEIDRAEGKSLEEEFSRQRHECNGSYRDARYRDGSTNRGRERDYDNRMPEYQSSHSHRYNQPSRASSQPPEYSSQNQASQYGRIRQRSNEDPYSSSSSRRRERDYRDDSVEKSRGRRSDSRSESRGHRDHDRSGVPRHHRDDSRARRCEYRSDHRGYR